MKYISTYTDRLAISLSALCVLHCLATPLLIVLLPSVMAMQLENEAFHKFLLMAVIPISILSLLIGCKKHERYQLLVVGFVGIAFLISATLVEGMKYGETMEKVLTVIGALIVAVGHYFNFRLCKIKKSDCGCN